MIGGEGDTETVGADHGAGTEHLTRPPIIDDLKQSKEPMFDLRDVLRRSLQGQDGLAVDRFRSQVAAGIDEYYSHFAISPDGETMGGFLWNCDYVEGLQNFVAAAATRRGIGPAAVSARISPTRSFRNANKDGRIFACKL